MMDIRTSHQLRETFARVEVLMAAVEAMSKALSDAEQRIQQLEDETKKRRQTKHGNRQ